MNQPLRELGGASPSAVFQQATDGSTPEVPASDSMTNSPADSKLSFAP